MNEIEKFKRVFGVTPREMAAMTNRRVFIQHDEMSLEDIESGRVLSFYAEPPSYIHPMLIGFIIPHTVLGLPYTGVRPPIKIPGTTQQIVTVTVGNDRNVMAVVDQLGNIYFADIYHNAEPISIVAFLHAVDLLGDHKRLLSTVVAQAVSNLALDETVERVIIRRTELSEEKRDIITTAAIAVADRLYLQKVRAAKAKMAATVQDLQTRLHNAEAEVERLSRATIQEALSVSAKMLQAGWRVNTDGRWELNIAIDRLKSGREIRRIPEDMQIRMNIVMGAGNRLHADPPHPHIDSNGVPCWGDYASLPLVDRLCALDFFQTVNLDDAYACDVLTWAKDLWKELPESAPTIFVVDEPATADEHAHEPDSEEWYDPAELAIIEIEMEHEDSV